MMSPQNDITKLLKKIYSSSENLETWIQTPQETTKQWQFDLDSEKIDIVKATIHYISNNLEQVQEVRYVNQYTIKKISHVMRHGIFSFYTMMTIQVIAFVLGIVVFAFGIYAFFQVNSLLGFFLCCLGIPPITYFLIEKPLQDLNQNIGNLVQTQIALGAWFNEMTYWQIHAKDSDFEEKQMVAQTMRDAAKWAVMLIEDYATHRSDEHGRTKKYSEVVGKVRDMVQKWQKKKKETDTLLLTNKTPQQDKPVENLKNAETSGEKNTTANVSESKKNEESNVSENKEAKQDIKDTFHEQKRES